LAPGGEAVLSRLVDRIDVVAVVSGRPVAQLRDRIAVPGLRMVGLYGLAPTEGRDRLDAARPAIEGLAASIAGAWVEDKGVSLAVHYRPAADPVRAASILAPALDDAARRWDLAVVTGKMVIELAAGPVPGKGDVIERLATEKRLDGCLFAGDDAPDLGAFAALDRLAATGSSVVKVAVRSEETPDELLAGADLVVNRPAGLLELLSRI
jgi:trehalose 6-phosphate phosphatase